MFKRIKLETDNVKLENVVTSRKSLRILPTSPTSSTFSTSLTSQWFSLPSPIRMSSSPTPPFALFSLSDLENDCPNS